jgi:hypothetical protein
MEEWIQILFLRSFGNKDLGKGDGKGSLYEEDEWTEFRGGIFWRVDGVANLWSWVEVKLGWSELEIELGEDKDRFE